MKEQLENVKQQRMSGPLLLNTSSELTFYTLGIGMAISVDKHRYKIDKWIPISKNNGFNEFITCKGWMIKHETELSWTELVQFRSVLNLDNTFPYMLTSFN